MIVSITRSSVIHRVYCVAYPEHYHCFLAVGLALVLLRPGLSHPAP